MVIRTVQNIRDDFKMMWEHGIFVPDKSGKRVIELLGAQFVADDSTIFGTPNEDYIRREIAWYESMSPSVNDMEPPVPKIWQEVSSKDGLVNSNYGRLIFHPNFGEQYRHTFEELRSNMWSRRAIMIYTRPTMWLEYRTEGMSDFVCTNDVQYFIRENPSDKSQRLFAYVQMRSNDAIFGYRNDWAWQKYVLDKLWNDLLPYYPGLRRGAIIWNVGSLHIYEDHFYLLQHYAHTGHFTKGNH